MNLAMLATQLSTRIGRTAGAPDSTPPTAQIVGVSPTPRNSDVSAITVLFSEPVSGLDASKFTLKRDGGANLLTGSEPVTSNDGGRTWTMGGLSFLTESEGTYVLELVGLGSGVVDAAGNELSGTVSTTWAVDLTYPTASITAVSPDPISVPVDTIDVVFSEAVSGVSLSRFTLKKDGGANLLTGAQGITTSDFITYTITGLAPITGQNGQYVLSLLASTTTIFDAAGNGLLGTASETWQANTAAPPTVAITAVSPAPRSDGVTSMTIVFSEAVAGFTLADLTLSLTRDAVLQSANLLTGSQTLTTADNITWTLNNLVGITRGRGDYVLTVLSGGITSVATGKAVQVGDTEAWSAIVLPWAPTANTFRTVHGYHGLALQNDTVAGGALAALAVTSAGQNGTEYELTLTIPADQDFRDGDKVVVEGSSAAGANGYFSIVKTASNKIKLVGSTYAGNGTGGKCYRWVIGRFDQLGMFAISANHMRGLEISTNLAGGGLLTPYGVYGNVYCVTGAAEVSGTVRLTVTGHPFSNNDVVEVSGVRVNQTNAEVFHGCWTVTVNDANTITLNGATWPRTKLLPVVESAVYSANTGIVRLHTIAKLQRDYLLSGGVDNPSAVTIVSQAAADDQPFSYKQARALLGAWMRAHLDQDLPHYFSTGNIGTPEEVLNRGLQSSYPMPMVNLDATYFNNWGIVSSDSNGGLCRLTLTKTPMSDWDHGAVRVVVLNHSNPSYGLDRYIDHDANNNRDGIAAFDRMIGVSGTALGGSTTTLNEDTQFNPAVVLGAQCHFLTGANAGLTRTIRSVANGNLTIEFDSALPFTVDNQHTYRITCYGYEIASVSPGTNQITLDVPYRSADGTGGCVLLFGDNTGITQGDPRTGGGFYARLTTAVANGFGVGDYVVLSAMTGAAAASYNCNGSILANPTDRVTIAKVVSVKSSKVVDLDVAYAGAASGGQWFATCQFLCTTFNGSRVGTRIDQPDYRRTDVLAKFKTDFKAHLDTIFARDGASHIGVFDECSLRHASSPSQTIRVFGSLNGETSAETIARVGEVIQHMKDTWCRTGSVNTTTWLTKDSLSVTDRNALVATWGGFISESACPQFDRSVYQMLDGWIAHVTAMLDGGLVYDYQTQVSGIGTVSFSSARADVDGTGRLELVFSPSRDPGTYPTAGETTQADLGNPHNHSGHVIGVHIAGGSAINGVHRIWKRKVDGAGNHRLILETPWPGGTFSTGFIVRANTFVPMKVTSIADNGSGKVRVTTEFPHYLPDADDATPYVTLYGWAGSAGQPVDGVAYAATKVGTNTFDITVNSGAGTSGGGIAVWGDGGTLTSDQNHALGVFWMLFDGVRAMRINLPLPASASPWVTYVPSGLSPDGDYSHDLFDGSADSGSFTSLTDAASAFTDAVLGEYILFTSGPNANLWRRITAVNSATQITFDAFPNAVAAGHAFTIGKTTTGDVAKVLQLSRNFNSGARRVEVYPQKGQVKYTGSWN